MRLKDNTVNISGLHPRIYEAMFEADQVCRRILGFEMVITSARDGKHMAGSFHYIGCAWDLRTWTSIGSGRQASRSLKNLLAQAVQDTLGDEFDVVLYNKDGSIKNHIHIEYHVKYLKAA